MNARAPVPPIATLQLHAIGARSSPNAPPTPARRPFEFDARITNALERGCAPQKNSTHDVPLTSAYAWEKEKEKKGAKDERFFFSPLSSARSVNVSPGVEVGVWSTNAVRHASILTGEGEVSIAAKGRGKEGLTSYCTAQLCDQRSGSETPTEPKVQYRANALVRRARGKKRRPPHARVHAKKKISLQPVSRIP